MNRKKLAVIIPCYNKLYYTQKTIESLLPCTESELTIIIVDDNSSDETAQYAMEVGERMNKAGAGALMYHRCSENIGVNAAWNTGLRIAVAAEFDYICIANNDLLFTQGWDTPLMDALDNGYSIVSPYSTEQVIPSDWPQGSTRHVNPVNSGMTILGACFMFKRDLVNTIGYFPEQMRHYFGDNWIKDQVELRKLKAGHIYESYIHHFFCQTTSGLDNNHWFKHDGNAYNEYCRNFKLNP